jgi:DNA-binding response OmpR family regulator
MQGVLDSGINFIRKPFTVHELTASIRQVLDNRGMIDAGGKT